MSDREILYQLLDAVPDTKISYLIGYVQGLTVESNDVPNKDTIAAFHEGDQMLKDGSGQKLTSVDDLFNELEG